MPVSLSRAIYRISCAPLCVATLLLAPVALTGCGDDKVTSANNGDNANGDNADNNGGNTDERRLRNQGDSNTVALGFGETKSIDVLLTDGDSPLGGQKVQFLIMGTNAGTVLTSPRAEIREGGARASLATGSDGSASISVKGGAAGASFDVQVTDLCEGCTSPDDAAPPLTFRVVVSENPLGDIEVALTYPNGRTQLRAFQLLLYQGNFTCSPQGNRTALSPSSPPPGALVQSPQFTRLSDKTLFEALEAGSNYYILGSAFDANMNLVAGGCIPASGDSITVTGGQKTAVTLPLADLPPNLVGQFTMRNFYNFGDSIPGTAGDVISAVTDPFDSDGDPARYLLDLLQGELGFDFDFPGGSAIENAAVSLINNLLLEQIPENLGTGGEIWGLVAQGMRDLSTFIRRLEVISEFDIEAVDADGNVTLHETWQEVVLEWQGQSATFQLNAQSGFREEIKASYTAKIREEGANRTFLDIPAYELTVDYGRFFALYLNEVLIPALTGTLGTGAPVDTLGGLFNFLIPCDSLAAGADNLDCDEATGEGCDDGLWKLLGFFEFAEEDIEDACVAVLDGIGLQLEGELEKVINQDLSTLNMCIPDMTSGEATCTVELKDEDSNREIETFKDGVWNGTMVATDDDVSGPFTGCFNGLRSSAVTREEGELNIRTCDPPTND